MLFLSIYNVLYTPYFISIHLGMYIIITIVLSFKLIRLIIESVDSISRDGPDCPYM